MQVRGIRGAITVEENTAEKIITNTKILLSEIIKQNNIRLEDIVSCTFSVTRDLDTVYPAVAAREMGWATVPLMCVNEMFVSGSLERVIRVLLLVNTMKSQKEVRHVYLKKAKQLRPDLAIE